MQLSADGFLLAQQAAGGGLSEVAIERLALLRQRKLLLRGRPYIQRDFAQLQAIHAELEGIRALSWEHNIDA